MTFLTRTILWAIACVGGLAPVVPVAAGRQGRPVEISPRPTWRSNVQLVTLAATVTDGEGRLVPGLTRDDFVLYEDGVEQPIAQFVGDRVPVSLGILVDISESMIGRRMEDARFAITRFLRDLLAPDDEAFLCVFNHQTRIVAPWTATPATLGRELDAVTPSGGTAIYDAVMKALPVFARRANQRAAIVVISDGADTASDHDVNAVRVELRRNDAFLYAIAIDAPGRRPISGRVDPYALKDMTDDSGGYTEVVKDSADLVVATSRIADELNHQYLIGYVPPRAADGRYHSIRLRARTAGYVVRTRKGYVAAPN